MASTIEIFCCYAHEDEAILNKLKTHLKPLQREGLIDIWYDREIRAGTEWEQEIKEHLNTAQIILLLVSPDFMDSDYCYSTEMKRALERHGQGEACVIPVILRPVYWQGILGKLQALPTDATPVTSSYWHSIDEAFFDVAEGIRIAVEKLISPLQETEENKSQIIRAKADVAESSKHMPNQWLRRERQLRGWSQTHLATLIGGVPDFYISQWERGEDLPNLYYQQVLCEVFGKSAEELGFHKTTLSSHTQIQIQRSPIDNISQNPNGGYAPPSDNTLGTSLFGLSARIVAGSSYVFTWITGIIILIFERRNQFVRFHAMQSVIVFGVITVLSLLYALAVQFITSIHILDVLTFLNAIISLISLFLWILLMGASFSGRYFKIPVIGDFALRYAKRAQFH